jgi:hypothetical protein
MTGADRGRSSLRAAQLVAGAGAGPLLLVSSTVLGSARAGYDWRRHAVSSLARGPEGWRQRVVFVASGTLCTAGGIGLAGAPTPVAPPSAAALLVVAAGAGLVASGVFVTDPVDGFSPEGTGADGPRGTARRSTEGALHEAAAVPVFVGVPVAGLLTAWAAVRRGDRTWAACCAASSLVMGGGTAVFAAGVGEGGEGSTYAGAAQRVAIAAGLGWVSAASLRTLRGLRRRA